MKVLVECFHDWALVRALGVRRENASHQKGKGEVVSRLGRAADETVGLIDEDPGAGGRPAALRNYQPKEESHGLRLLEHRSGPRKLVVEFCPRLEEWLVARAAASAISMQDYELPETGCDLHRNPRCDRSPKFRDFLAELLRKDAGMRQLRDWLGG